MSQVLHILTLHNFRELSEVSDVQGTVEIHVHMNMYSKVQDRFVLQNVSPAWSEVQLENQLSTSDT